MPRHDWQAALSVVKDSRLYAERVQAAAREMKEAAN
jgi:hypothetical protein